jgi:serine/threonine protein kinase
MFKKLFRKKDKKDSQSSTSDREIIKEDESEQQIQKQQKVSTPTIWHTGKIVADIYEVVRELGHGGMGVVYLLRERGSNRFAAAKLPLGEFVSDKLQRQRFTREAQVWTELAAHPNIVRAYDVKEIDYRPCIFMEYVDGGSVANRLRSYPGGLPFEEAFSIAIQICWAMEFAHEKGHTHRDLKPANLMRKKEGIVKVTDFGLVKRIGINEVSLKEKIADSGLPVKSEELAEITQKGTVMGTPPYMSPEQWEGNSSTSSDIYAFGVILFELFCGKRPLDPRTHPKYREMDINPQFESYFYKLLHQQEKPLDPSSLRDGLPLEARDLILRCLEKRLEDRPKNFLTIGNELIELYPKIIRQPFSYKKPGKVELDKSQKIDRAWALIRLGAGCKFRGDLDEALSLFQQSEQLFKETNNRAGMSTCYRNMGTICDDRGDYERALKSYQKSLKIDEELGDRAGISNCYNNMGLILYSKGDYKGALELYQKSLKIMEELGDRSGMSVRYFNMGSVLYYRGEYKGALKLYQKSLEIKEEIGDRAGMSKCYNNMGLIFKSRGDYKGALKLYQKSLEIAEEIGDRTGMSLCYGNMCNILYSRGEYEKALKLYQKCLEIMEEIGDRSGISKCCYGIGNILYQRGDYKGALKLYQKSLKIAAEIGDKEGILDCCNNMGLIYDHFNEKSKAKEMYCRCLALTKELGLPIPDWLPSKIKELSG